MSTDHLAGPSRLVALDWGTTALRAYLIGEDGVVMDRRSEALGILQVADRNFAAVLESVTLRWRGENGELPVIASGMIGSAQGWVEAAYVDAPADLETVARALVRVPGSPLLV